MRKNVLLLFLGIAGFGYGQKDTVQVSLNTAIMIFPANISDAYLGDELEFFINDKKSEGSIFSKRILKLYANEDSDKDKAFTTLLVITADGNSYEFILESTTTPSRTTWYISPDQAETNILGKQISNAYQIGDELKNLNKIPDVWEMGAIDALAETSIAEGSEDKKETAIPTAELYESDRAEYFRLRCYYMQFDRPKIPRFFSRAGNVFLWLKGVYYGENEIYAQFKIENSDGVDLDIKLLKFSIASTYKNSGSNRKSELDDQDIPFKYKIPKKVKGGTENHFVVVFKKFSLDRNKVLVVDMDEENGNRNLSLEIDHGIINNPFKIK